ncbi:hypothetical protein D910_12617 [Dendroctonus ponderosae]|uniref:Uncharacterized protein n=1 Tax=Dendroctonus ponderosae TaxID=77166 RepID=U4UQJ2_DENPD|nr:hypothetical protein D910_12617 [Dendroctonus ponderosae]
MTCSVECNRRSSVHVVSTIHISTCKIVAKTHINSVFRVVGLFDNTAPNLTQNADFLQTVGNQRAIDEGEFVTAEIHPSTFLCK